VCVEVSDLTFAYRDCDVLQQISLSISPGQIYALLGPNGAGKSTLQKILRGSLRPRSGQVRVFGVDPWMAPASWRARLAWVNDVPAIHPRLTVGETLRFYAGLYGLAQGRQSEVMVEAGLTGLDKRYVAQLSRGQQQRLAWAKALLVGADLWLLDEPTNGLDVAAKEEVHQLVRSLRGRGRSLLLSTHDMREAQDLADQVGILHQGQLVAQGSPEQLCQEYLGQSLGDPHLQPSLERVYGTVTGRSLYAPAEGPPRS
jgi:heme ABC exporter ATP-binding subunit CcmA